MQAKTDDRVYLFIFLFIDCRLTNAVKGAWQRVIQKHWVDFSAWQSWWQGPPALKYSDHQLRRPGLGISAWIKRRMYIVAPFSALYTCIKCIWTWSVLPSLKSIIHCTLRGWGYLFGYLVNCSAAASAGSRAVHSSWNVRKCGMVPYACWCCASDATVGLLQQTNQKMTIFKQDFSDSCDEVHPQYGSCMCYVECNASVALRNHQFSLC